MLVASCPARERDGRAAANDHVHLFFGQSLAGIDHARFKRPVIPGDQLLLEVILERSVRGIWKFSAKARVGENLAAEAKLMCTVRST